MKLPAFPREDRCRLLLKRDGAPPIADDVATTDDIVSALMECPESVRKSLAVTIWPEVGKRNDELAQRLVAAESVIAGLEDLRGGIKRLDEYRAAYPEDSFPF